jgi:hypothetical protein
VELRDAIHQLFTSSAKFSCHKKCYTYSYSGRQVLFHYFLLNWRIAHQSIVDFDNEMPVWKMEDIFKHFGHTDRKISYLKLDVEVCLEQDADR